MNFASFDMLSAHCSSIYTLVSLFHTRPCLSPASRGYGCGLVGAIDVVIPVYDAAFERAPAARQKGGGVAERGEAERHPQSPPPPMKSPRLLPIALDAALDMRRPPAHTAAVATPATFRKREGEQKRSPRRGGSAVAQSKTLPYIRSLQLSPALPGRRRGSEAERRHPPPAPC
mmetsp:Transcript_50742/g.100964  ORF Transcript_50742/g.100964 Transcript_50742/m.100964 type:complete len:173 (-) Transcript_50742:2166-2684(-)